MNKKLLLTVPTVLAALAAGLLMAQDAKDIVGIIKGGSKSKIAIPDFRGSGDAQPLMSGFNTTLWDEISGAGVVDMVGKSFYPLETPQRPTDFRVKDPNVKIAPATNGRALTDWAGAPVNANYLAFGYTGVQDGRLVLYGWLYNAGAATPQAAQLIGKTYFGDLNADGAKKAAREFAADILATMGVKSLSGTRIIYVSDRSGNREIYAMDYDGTNQKQLTAYRSTSMMPAISPDGRLVAFTTYAGGNPQIRVHSVEGGRRLSFYNPVSSVVETPEFTPDGKQMMFAAAIDGWVQLCIADVDGGNMRRVSNVRAIEVSPRINPKNGREVLFISGRSGKQQLWLMNLDGGAPERLTTGEGDVANPSWSPDGQFIAFAWTRGYEPGNFNIFVMDVAKRQPIQLTHGVGRNENPFWAPDGLHLVYSSMRGRSTQIFTMLVDGTNVKQLTTQGNNLQPVWGQGIN
jgi:TolB protein